MQVVPHIVLSFSVFWSAPLDTVDIKQKTKEKSKLHVGSTKKNSYFSQSMNQSQVKEKNLAGPFFATEGV